ncbi:MAG: GatB/YqeY domain-containing protein, partial [Anaerolineales bacterium]
EEARQADRPDLEAEAEAEIEVLEKYLPQPMTEVELEDQVQQVIDEVGAASPREMGQVMKVLMPRLQGRATGQEASQVVRKLLEQ